MALSIYLSYGYREDKTIAFRLQAIAALHGLEAYLPETGERVFPSAAPSGFHKLDRSDFVVGIASRSVTAHMAHELAWALKYNKPAVLLLGPNVRTPADIKNLHIFRLDPSKPPGRIEQELVQYVREVAARRQIKLKKQETNDLAWLLVIGLGLLFLYLSTKD